MKLKFNNLPEILEWIRDPQHKEHLFLLQAAIDEAKGSKSSKSQFNVGDKVIFGRPNGRKHHGFIVKKNPAKAVVDCAGSKWRVPYSLMEAA